MTTALFIGRFQPFHLGHLHVIKEALKEVDKLIIGVGHNKQENKKENPFSVEQRIEMIDSTLPNHDITNYTVFPIPDYPDDNKWAEKVETLVPEFEIVYMSDKNTFGEKWVERCFKKKYTIRKIKALKGIDATTIRENIKEKKPWKNMVPKEVYGYISRFGLV